MHNMLNSESEEPLLSPSAFMNVLNQPLDYAEQNGYFQNSYISGDKDNKRSLVTSVKSSQKGLKKRQAGIKSREKKKQYLQSLEQDVSELKSQIQKYDTQISQCKDQLVQAIKLSTTNSSQHAYTFNQLQRLLKGDYPDLDKINLLLDLIHNRIGANAKQRQSKLQYNFKQIINSLFPAIHRYFMYSAVNNIDLFKEDVTPQQLVQENTNWTKLSFRQKDLNETQIVRIGGRKKEFMKKQHETIDLIRKLKKVKQQIKQQQQIFENAITHFRQDLNPTQSSLIILFGQKNKLRKQFCIFEDQLNGEDSLKKKIKTDLY